MQPQSERARRVRDTFREVTGRAPVSVWSAPGRVNLIGEHTDYNAGLALPIALPHRTYAAAAPRDDGRLRVWSVQAPGPVEVALDEIAPGRDLGWVGYVAGVLWVLRDEGIDVPGLDVVVDSSVPVGAGLSSSAALECAVLVAAAALVGVDLLHDDLARQRAAGWARRAENEVVGAPTGGMDQLAAMLARTDQALLLDFAAGHHQRLDCVLPGHELLVIDTRAEHRLVDGAYARRRQECERAADTLGVNALRNVDIRDLDGALQTVAARTDGTVARRVRHVVTEIARVADAADALRHNDCHRLGEVFTASHGSLRDDFEVSCPELDVAVASAIAHGAIGARMTGGGFGGSAIALVPTAAVEAVVEGVRTAYRERGWIDPAIFAAPASDGARRDL